MEEINFFYALVIGGVFASSCSQLLLKKSADVVHESWLKSMLNWRVVLAYIIFFGSLFLNITSMSHGVNLKDVPILESLGYVFVPFLSFVILKEKPSIRTIISIALILVGIFIFFR